MTARRCPLFTAPLVLLAVWLPLRAGAVCDPSAPRTTNWFDADATGSFADDTKWTRTPEHPSGNPPALAACENDVAPITGESTYVGRDSTATVEDSGLESGQLYVAGWHAEFDAIFGPSGSDVGTLLIEEDGDLTVSGCTAEPNTDCYVRVGLRGARGAIEQTGGELNLNNAVTIAVGSAESNGVYTMSGGTLNTIAIDVGAQGTGTFQMTGGTVDATCCASTVGWGYENYQDQIGGPGVIAGHGTLEQSGGTIEVGALWLTVFNGDEEGSTADVEFSGSALFNTPRLRGGEGVATVIQHGGEVRIDCHIMLGEIAGGSATYEISGGTLTQTDCGDESQLRPFGSSTGPLVPNGLHVGYEGHGEFTVVGDDATIEVDHYHQTDDSLLTVKLESTGANVSAIQVAGTATFAEGAQVKAVLLNGFDPSYFTAFTLMTADEIDGLPELVDAPDNSWSIQVQTGTPTILRLVRGGPVCGLLGIEPALALLLAQAVRRARKRN